MHVLDFFFFFGYFRVLLQIGAAFLLVLLLLVLAIGVIHDWATNNFYLTRAQMLFVCFLAFLLALSAFIVGWFQGTDSFPFILEDDQALLLLFNFLS